MRALTHAVEIKITDVVVHSDSELLVKQMTGIYKVKNEALRELYLEAKGLAKQIPHFSLIHVRRAENSAADKLCNEALDGVAGRQQSQGQRKPAASPRPADRQGSRGISQSVAEFWEMGCSSSHASRSLETSS